MTLRTTIIRPPVYSVGLMGAQRVPVLGVVYIAAVLCDAGLPVDVIDMLGEDIERTEIVDKKFVQYGMSFDALDQRLLNKDVIFFSCMFSQDWPFHKRLIEKVRALLPQAILIAGGEHVSALPEYCLDDCRALDICVIGEGEHICLSLLRALECQGPLDLVAGIFYRDVNTSEIKKTEPADRITDIDSIVWPAWGLIPLDQYLDRGFNSHMTRGRTIPMLATRGCPHECSFCSNKKMWRRAWVPRDPKDVVAEMKFYMNRYQVENFIFSDLTVVIHKQKILDFCAEIKNVGLRCTWQLPTLRTEVVDRDVLQALYDAGCRELDFSVESASAIVLKQVKKKNDPQRMLSLIAPAKEIGFNVSLNIVIGLPDERWRDFFRSFCFVMRAACKGLDDINVFPFIPYPGSELFDELLASGKIELDDHYFKKLFGYANLSQPVSFCRHSSPFLICGFRFLLLGSFYSVMLLSNPKRIVDLFKSLKSGKPNSKLANVLSRIFTNIHSSKSKTSAKLS